jgi:hypothetical protein
LSLRGVHFVLIGDCIHHRASRAAFAGAAHQKPKLFHALRRLLGALCDASAIEQIELTRLKIESILGRDRAATNDCN